MRTSGTGLGHLFCKATLSADLEAFQLNVAGDISKSEHRLEPVVVNFGSRN
jgi:hypothetical protein